MEGVPSLSVIIPCLNAEDYLECQLEALASQQVPFPWEVVLVDNGSTDRSVQIAEGFKDRIPLLIVSATDRLGSASAQNVGLKHARAKKVLVIGADDQAAPGFVTSMYAALQEHDFVTSISEVLSLNPVWARHAHEVPETAHGGPWPPFAGGSALGVSRQALDSVGGFPEEYGPTWDIGLSIRLQLAGFPLYYLPERLLRYRYRTSIPGLFRQTRHWGYYQPLLYRDFGPDTVHPRTLRRALSDWLGAASKLIGARSKGDLAQSAVRFGYCLGRLQGSYHFRVLFL